MRVCRVTERWWAHALFTRHPSKPDLAVLSFGRRPFSRRGAEDVVGRPDGRTLPPLSGPQGAAATLSHRCKTADCKSAIRAQPAVCQSDTFSGASCSRAAVRVKAGTVTGQRKQFSSRFNSLSGDGTTTAELQYPLLHKPIY